MYPDYDLGEKLAGAYVTHNHPISETHYSFSYDDLSLFMEYRLPHLTGVDDEYIYIVRRTDKTAYADRAVLEHAYKGENYADFMSASWQEELDPDKDEYDYYVRKLAEEYGFEYERKRR